MAGNEVTRTHSPSEEKTLSAMDAASLRPEFSTAGFHEVAESDRTVRNFNVGWRFAKGPAPEAESRDFDDASWPLVNLPHGLEVLPLEASGGVNYQGRAWYRKRFDVPSELEGRRVVLHFEGLMGKSRFWVNGKPLKSHFGGYLPCIVDLSDAVEYGTENLIAVQVDNSDDPSYPPGKPQAQLDFAYFGGIYRDVWLVSTNRIHITDPNEVDRVAGGGVFVHFDDVSDDRATVCVETHVANCMADEKALRVEALLTDTEGAEVARYEGALVVEGNGEGAVAQKFIVRQPHLWHVDDPYLHDLVIRVSDESDQLLDALRLRVGIRRIEFRGKEGFFLNGRRPEDKLIGTNRHQDYAYVGNAMSNGAHWRDAVKLREAGMRVIRCAHYPQDPAFMDACDELGMLVIIATPGWQFWSDDTVFEERVYSDIRNMVRRDRNRPSAWLWEPILNETNYPDHFAKRVHEICHEEYPHPGCYTACDLGAEGQEHFDVVYAHVYRAQQMMAKTDENREEYAFDYGQEKRCVFTREWGDCVANWRAQSSPSRVAKGWGERAQLVQARHYADPDHIAFSSYESLSRAPAQHVGGTLWHGIDHQRGYHADPFWGGIMDATRRPKHAYHMFRSQVQPGLYIPHVETGPFAYIAHMMHPTCGSDVTVFSNCDEVRLFHNDEVVGTLPTHPEGTHMPHRPAVFEGVFRHIRRDQSLKAEGLINGEVVATATRRPWDRRHRLDLEVDLAGAPLVADGGDFVPVVARIVDKSGEVVRLTDDTIRFSVEGGAELIGGDVQGINPQKLCWGEAVALVRAGTIPGTVTVRAESLHEGAHKPLTGEVSFETVPAAHPLHFSERPETGRVARPVGRGDPTVAELKRDVARLSAELNELRVAKVEKQQEDSM